MDSGCDAADDPADNGQESTARPLLPTEVIGIVDQLLCLEVRIPGRHRRLCSSPR